MSTNNPPSLNYLCSNSCSIKSIQTAFDPCDCVVIFHCVKALLRLSDFSVVFSRWISV